MNVKTGLRGATVILMFVDTEFTSFGLDGLDPQLISIGLVAGHRELYLEIAGIDPAQCSQFTRDVVLPLLDGGAVVRTFDAASLEVSAWIKSLGDDVVPVCDLPMYDLELLAELLGARWPRNLRRRPYWPEGATKDAFDRSLSAVRGQLVASGRAHHALEDARALSTAWRTANLKST